MSTTDTQGALRLVTPPADKPVSLIDAKVHLRVDSDDEDTLITGLITAAVEALDGKSGYLGRCLMPQTWALTLDGGFPCERIVLPLGPVPAKARIASIAYVDAAGATQALAGSAYDFHARDGLDDSFIVPVYGTAWPSTRCQLGAVTITYEAGYADAAAVPQAIRVALLMMVAQLYNDRESELKISGSIEALLRNYRQVCV